MLKKINSTYSKSLLGSGTLVESLVEINDYEVFKSSYGFDIKNRWKFNKKNLKFL